MIEATSNATGEITQLPIGKDSQGNPILRGDIVFGEDISNHQSFRLVQNPREISTMRKGIVLTPEILSPEGSVAFYTEKLSLTSVDGINTVSIELPDHNFEGTYTTLEENHTRSIKLSLNRRENGKTDIKSTTISMEFEEGTQYDTGLNAFITLNFENGKPILYSTRFNLEDHIQLDDSITYNEINSVDDVMTLVKYDFPWMTTKDIYPSGENEPMNVYISEVVNENNSIPTESRSSYRRRKKIDDAGLEAVAEYIKLYSATRNWCRLCELAARCLDTDITSLDTYESRFDYVTRFLHKVEQIKQKRIDLINAEFRRVFPSIIPDEKLLIIQSEGTRYTSTDTLGVSSDVLGLFEGSTGVMNITTDNSLMQDKAGQPGHEILSDTVDTIVHENGHIGNTERNERGFKYEEIFNIWKTSVLPIKLDREHEVSKPYKKETVFLEGGELIQNMINEMEVKVAETKTIDPDSILASAMYTASTGILHGNGNVTFNGRTVIPFGNIYSEIMGTNIEHRLENFSDEQFEKNPIYLRTHKNRKPKQILSSNARKIVNMIENKITTSQNNL